MELFVKVRLSLVDVNVKPKERVIIGSYGFLLRPMAKRAFYKLLRVQEVSCPTAVWKDLTRDL